MVSFGSVQSFSRIGLFANYCTAVLQSPQSITNSRSLLKLMLIKSVLPSNHLILCYPLPLLPSIFPSIRVFSNVSVLHIRWPKFSSFIFSMSLSNEYLGLIFLSLISCCPWDLRVLSNNTVQKHQFSTTQVF